jgi:hypothetical protein
MSLPVLVAIVAVGIAVIVLAVHMTGGSKAASLASPAHAKGRFLEDFPDEQAADVLLTADRKAAFLALELGNAGLVHSVGARFLTRRFSNRDIVSVRRTGPAGLLLRTTDFTFAGGRFEFADAATADRVAQLLQPAAIRSEEAA